MYNETTKLIESLEHWAKCFKDGTLDDSNAEEIAYLLEDKAHDLRTWQIKATRGKDNAKN